ncbi:NADPH-dependent F420 reductase [Amycolatopsis sp. NPDC059027]|uniref:NADPH-dependent F420 reductase n=1 Tax=unclassified Amycolatopsis TaxID=2618356 RepID=UPI0036722D13
MRIGIFGTGGMADALGTQWARAGHDLLVSGRDPAKAAALAKQFGARSGSWTDAVEFADAILLALPADSVLDVLDAAGAASGALDGITLIDPTNAVDETLFPQTPPGTSMAEQITAKSVGAHVVKAFNLCHVDTWRLTPPVFGGRPLAVPLCGDDERALDHVRTLVRDLGCVPLDGGGLDRAVLMEATMAFVVKLWFDGADAQAILPPPNV